MFCFSTSDHVSEMFLSNVALSTLYAYVCITNKSTKGKFLSASITLSELEK